VTTVAGWDAERSCSRDSNGFGHKQAWMVGMSSSLTNSVDCMGKQLSPPPRDEQVRTCLLCQTPLRGPAPMASERLPEWQKSHAYRVSGCCCGVSVEGDLVGYDMSAGRARCMREFPRHLTFIVRSSTTRTMTRMEGMGCLTQLKYRPNTTS
jgi:hypothetical protein